MNIKVFFYHSIYIIMGLYHSFTSATVYLLPDPNNRLIGENIEIFTPKNNIHSLEFFSEHFQVGISNMLEANPNVDVYLPDSEKRLIIPHQLILPNTPRLGVVINSAEMRLYYYPENNNIVIVLPIAIGTVKHATPSNWMTSIKYKKKIQFGFLQKICVMNILNMEKYCPQFSQQVLTIPWGYMRYI
nr:hypothetical protein [Blochmannia endosymbiont of Camponotus nipponensis]